jgi:esterase
MRRHFLCARTMKTLRVNDYELSYLEQGQGAPLVLVHGTLCDLRNWTPQMEAFSARYRTFALSMRHCWPEKWNGDGDDFTIRQHTADVAAFIETLGLSTVHLVGHSRGGHIAFRVAQAIPDKIATLVLQEPGGSLSSELEEMLPPGQPLGLGPLFAAIADLIRAGRIDEAMRLNTDTLLGTGEWEKMGEGSRAMMCDNAQTMLAQIRETRFPFTLDDTRSIRPPTLLIQGDRTLAGFKRIVSVFGETIPVVRTVTIPNASHCSNADNSQVYNTAVLEFLASA